MSAGGQRGPQGLKPTTLAWLFLAVLSVIALVTMALAGAAIDGPAEAWPLVLLGWPVVGGLVTLNRPDNIIGRLLIAFSAPLSFSLAVEAYLLFSLTEHRLPATDLAAWAWGWLFTPVLFVLALLVSHFPTGRISSSWLLWLVRIVGVITVVMVVGRMLAPVEQRSQGLGEAIANPWGIEALASYTAIDGALGSAGVLLLVLAMLDLVMRWRRSHGIERLQMHWLSLVSLMFALAVLVTFLIREAVELSEGTLNLIDTAGWLSGLGLLPVAIGVAVARHRLYDIDRIINRTLVYALLTATLAAVYLGLVVGLQAVLSSLSGGSGLAIALTTLAVAALFLPARARIQRAVDRRFNRRQYDAAHTIDAFAARMRDQIDLDTLRYEVLAVLDETMQPARASVWLRAGEGRK